MKNEEIISALSEKVNETVLAGEYGSWEDLCIEMPVSDPDRAYNGIVIWGEENSNGEKYFSISLRKGYGENGPGAEVAKSFSNTSSLSDLEAALVNFLGSIEMQKVGPTPEISEPPDRFLRINNLEFSFDAVAKALGMEVGPHLAPVQVKLCQRVDSGVLVAKGSFFDHDDYPGIDLTLHLPPEADSLPVMITRTEQPREDYESPALRTFGYSRDDEYFMYFDADLRPDSQVNENMHAPSVTVSGNIYRSVEVIPENPNVHFDGWTPPSMPKNNLAAKIQDAASRAGQQSVPDKKNKQPGIGR